MLQENICMVFLPLLSKRIKKDYQVSVHVTVKKDVFKWYTSCTDLVESSVYHTKPTHFLIIVCE